MTGKPLQWSPVMELIRKSALRPASWLAAAAMIAVVFIAGMATDAFPPLQRDPPISYVLVGIIFVVAFLSFASLRGKLMPWGSQARSLMWGGITAFSAVIAFCCWAALTFANGALDHTPENLKRFAIVGRTHYRDYYLIQVEEESTSSHPHWNPFSVRVKEDDWEASEVGSLVLVDLRPGFLQVPWVAGYRVCDVDVCDQAAR